MPLDLTKDEKTIELIRHRDITLATIDYIVAGIDWNEIPDLRDDINEHYAQQRRQTEKYYHARRLDRLQQKLENLIKGPQAHGDLNFDIYIKQKTGHEIDIFEKIRKRTDAIIELGQIRNDKDLNDVATFFNAYEDHPEYQTKRENLKALIISFGQRSRKSPSKRNQSTRL
jgi:hypothetical protein